jgi:hypothetical protein
MEENFKSEGKCLFCGKMFVKAGINKHLSTHLAEKAMTTNQAGHSFLLKVETGKRYGKTPYFLSLWVDGETTLKNIDKFLRDIWLECCGHLSAFRYPRSKKGGGFGMFGSMKAFQLSPIDNAGDIPMSRKTKDILYKGLILEYVYDFGSSTKLSVSVVDEYPMKAEKKTVLLSRNEPMQMMCSTCGKAPATQICTVCTDDEDSGFCDTCADKHAEECGDFDDYASMRVVNSPRMGVCGYEGGSIDIERDGVYQI